MRQTLRMEAIKMDNPIRNTSLIAAGLAGLVSCVSRAEYVPATEQDMELNARHTAAVTGLRGDDVRESIKAHYTDLFGQVDWASRSEDIASLVNKNWARIGRTAQLPNEQFDELWRAISDTRVLATDAVRVTENLGYHDAQNTMVVGLTEADFKGVDPDKLDEKVFALLPDDYKSRVRSAVVALNELDTHLAIPDHTALSTLRHFGKVFSAQDNADVQKYGRELTALADHTENELKKIATTVYFQYCRDLTEGDIFGAVQKAEMVGNIRAVLYGGLDIGMIGQAVVEQHIGKERLETTLAAIAETYENGHVTAMDTVMREHRFNNLVKPLMEDLGADGLSVHEHDAAVVYIDQKIRDRVVDLGAPAPFQVEDLFLIAPFAGGIKGAVDLVGLIPHMNAYDNVVEALRAEHPEAYTNLVDLYADTVLMSAAFRNGATNGNWYVGNDNDLTTRAIADGIAIISTGIEAALLFSGSSSDDNESNVPSTGGAGGRGARQGGLDVDAEPQSYLDFLQQQKASGVDVSELRALNQGVVGRVAESLAATGNYGNPDKFVRDLAWAVSRAPLSVVEGHHNRALGGSPSYGA
jgi:hypothetical protein